MASNSGFRKAPAVVGGVPWSRAEPRPVVLLSGPEELLADRAFTKIQEQLKVSYPLLELVEISGSDYQNGVLSNAVSPSLFGEPRLVRFKELDKVSDSAAAELIDYFKAPEFEVFLVLRHAGGAKGKKILQELRKSSDFQEVNCSAITSEKARLAFAEQEFKAAKKQITPGAIRMLVTVFGTDLAGLASAAQQLISDQTGAITEETIAKYYEGRAEITAFQVVDHTLNSDLAQALTSFRQALESGVDLVPLVAAFASKFRTLALVAGLASRTVDPAKVNLQPWLIDRAKKELTGWTPRGLANVIAATAELDAAVKGESRQPAFLIEQLIISASNKGR